MKVEDYKISKTHPVLKAGGVLTKVNKGQWSVSSYRFPFTYSSATINKWIKEGYVISYKGEKYVNSVLALISSCEGVPVEQITSKLEVHRITEVRQIVAFILRKKTKLFQRQIGEYLGKRSAAWALGACKIVEDRISVDLKFKDRVNAILIKC